ncbi:hypothetical protein M758_1G266400 [Ceratodon purpureus]|nr:hypothetical protein M758_1G266400 [Ceratodon purpureus]
MALIGKILNAILYGFDYVSNIVVRRVSMAVIGKILSAFLYVFDYVSNIVVLWQYWNMFKTGHFYQNIEMDNQYFRTTSKVPFYVCLGLMICDPVVAAVAFMLKLRPGERPLLSVLLLPVIQLWKACRSESGDDTRPEAEALFAITVAMENGPQLVLQLSVIYFLVWNSSYDDVSVPVALKVSLVASFLSVSYNAGRAIMYHMTGKWPGKWGFVPNFSGIVGGIYTIGALLLRFAAVTTIIAAYGDSFSDRIYIVTMTVYFVVGIGVLSYVNGLMAHLLKGVRTCSPTAQMSIFVSSYMCATIGPLYPVIERTENSNERCRLWARLGLAVGMNMLPDLIVLIMSVSVKSDSIYPACERGTTHDYNLYMRCHVFIAYFTTGSVLCVLPCIIFPLISRTI